MQILQDKAYFASRAAKARLLAMAAADPRIRQIHLQMAKRYDGLAQTGLPLAVEQHAHFSDEKRRG